MLKKFKKKKDLMKQFYLLQETTFCYLTQCTKTGIREEGATVCRLLLNYKRYKAYENNLKAQIALGT